MRLLHWALFYLFVFSTDIKKSLIPHIFFIHLPEEKWIRFHWGSFGSLNSLEFRKIRVLTSILRLLEKEPESEKFRFTFLVSSSLFDGTANIVNQDFYACAVNELQGGVNPQCQRRVRKVSGSVARKSGTIEKTFIFVPVDFYERSRPVFLSSWNSIFIVVWEKIPLSRSQREGRVFWRFTSEILETAGACRSRRSCTKKSAHSCALTNSLHRHSSRFA